MFEYVSGANFLGEMVEWFGFAVANGTLPAIGFAFFTFCNIGPRACQHHRYLYKHLKTTFCTCEYVKHFKCTQRIN